MPGPALATGMSERDQSDEGRGTVWLETYRPKRLDEVAGQEAIVDRLESYVDRDDLPHMLFAGPAGVGKCVTGETPVLTDDGLARIETVVGESKGFSANSSGREILSLTETGEFEYTEPSHVFGKTAEELVSLSTRDGSEMTVTPEHRLLVCTHGGFKWRPAASVDAGDRIARPLEVPLPETDTQLDWVESMDGDRTFVHVTDTFAQRHDIPFEENLVGDQKRIVRELRNRNSVADIATRLDVPKQTVQAVEREFRDRNLDAPSTVCSLAFLRGLAVPEEELRAHTTQIQYANRNNRRSAPITPPDQLTPELAELLGLAISEARIEHGRLKFYNTDDRLCARFERILREQFAVEPRTGQQKSVPYVAINNRTLTHYLASCFDVLAGAAGETGIGSTILRGDDESRSAFLRAVCDAEAHVTKHGIFELTQKNEDIITLLSYLLATFGVPSRRTEQSKQAANGSGKARTYHALYVSSASHLARFEDAIGFTIDEKAERLAAATAKESNPNNDTIPTQDAVAELCAKLNLDKTAFVPESLNPDSPGRQRYLAAVSALVDAATERIERVQEARERLAELEPAIDEIAAVPARWADRRDELEPLGVRRQVQRETEIRKDQLLAYARGDRTPYTNRARRLIQEITQSQSIEHGAERDPIEVVQSELGEIVETLDISYEQIADSTALYGNDVGNLLDRDDHEISSLPRFATVADRIDTLLSRMASMETLRALQQLDTLVRTDVSLDEIETVERIDESRRVYDLTVPGTRNYVAGTVPTVMHNTTSAIAVARELYGEDWEEHFLELNASDERGIDVVRDRVKSFARTSFGGANYRIIFLDEADALTSEAQSALRRTMEQFSNNVRFILSCNYSSQIIDPIQSRCAVFRFSPLGDDAVAARVRKIAETEGINLTDDGVDALVYVAGGDMRAAINGLQAAAVTGTTVDEDAVFEITSTARPEDIRKLVTRALDGDFTAARSELDRLLTEEGIAGGDVIDQLHRAVWEFDLNDEDAVRLLDRIGETDYRITRGANERIQLEALLASVALD